MLSADTDPPSRPAPRRSDRARQALVSPWSRRRARRIGVVALVLIIFGPVVGTAVALLLVPAEPGDFVQFDEDQPALIDARGTIRSVDAITGEMALRLVLRPSDAPRPEDEPPLFDDDDILLEDVMLQVSDAQGQGVRTLPAGQPMGTVTAMVPLADSRASRYPVDRYRAGISVVARRAGDDARPIPLRLSLRTSDPGFSATVIQNASQDTIGYVELRISRRATVIGWAAFFVVVCWMLAVASASLGWTTVVHGIASPGWAMGFLIGVLFALPPLRNALPGSPPSGSLVDLAAFYWAVGVVALTLVAMMGSWNMRVRRAPGEPDSPAPRS